MSLQQRIATPDGKRRYVRTLFATISDRYDFITVALSYGRDRRWKKRLVDLAAPGPDVRALDLATGTGDIAFALEARGARVVGLDVTKRMIEIARAKQLARSVQPRDPLDGRKPKRLALRDREPKRLALHFLVADMVALPFANASFDLITTGYGLRNVPDLTAAIDEILRVLKPGGGMLSLDFNRPANRWVRSLYLLYLTLLGGALGWLLHRDADTYRYIPASIRTYPGAEGVARLMKARGFAGVRHYRVLGGLMAIHHGSK